MSYYPSLISFLYEFQKMWIIFVKPYVMKRFGVCSSFEHIKIYCSILYILRMLHFLKFISIVIVYFTTTIKRRLLWTRRVSPDPLHVLVSCFNPFDPQCACHFLFLGGVSFKEHTSFPFSVLVLCLAFKV